MRRWGEWVWSPLGSLGFPAAEVVWESLLPIALSAADLLGVPQTVGFSEEQTS